MVRVSVTATSQTGALLSLCWAKAHGMTLMVQDLTNPMLAQISHVLLAAHANTIMGVESNATFLRTEGKYPGREDERLPLTTSPDWIANLGIFYNHGRFTGRTSFMARSDRLTGVGSRAALDRYTEADRTLDLSLELAAMRGTTLFFHTRNLLNVPTVEFQGDGSNPVSTTYYGRQINFGLSYSL
jgi:hypothetical protein